MHFAHKKWQVLDSRPWSVDVHVDQMVCSDVEETEVCFLCRRFRWGCMEVLAG